MLRDLFGRFNRFLSIDTDLSGGGGGLPSGVSTDPAAMPDTGGGGDMDSEIQRVASDFLATVQGNNGEQETPGPDAEGVEGQQEPPATTEPTVSPEVAQLQQQLNDLRGVLGPEVEQLRAYAPLVQRIEADPGLQAAIRNYFEGGQTPATPEQPYFDPETQTHLQREIQRNVQPLLRQIKGLQELALDNAALSDMQSFRKNYPEVTDQQFARITKVGEERGIEHTEDAYKVAMFDELVAKAKGEAVKEVGTNIRSKLSRTLMPSGGVVRTPQMPLKTFEDAERFRQEVLRQTRGG